MSNPDAVKPCAEHKESAARWLRLIAEHLDQQNGSVALALLTEAFAGWNLRGWHEGYKAGKEDHA